MTKEQNNILFRIIQWATVSVFLGRAYQHWFWDAPFRTLLWDEIWMQGIVESLLGMSWATYTSSATVDAAIDTTISGFGVFYFVAALLAIFAKRIPSWARMVWLLGAATLVVLAALYCKEKFFSVGQFFEYSLQFSSPALLWYLMHKTAGWTDQNTINNTLTNPRFTGILKTLIALTFTCHGLYALGYYPIPGHFMDMVIGILGVSNASAVLFLKTVGILDFILAAMLFVPIRMVQLLALAYAIFWGFMTSIARIWAHFYWDFPWQSLHQWSYETVYRTPHFLLPLFLFLILWYRKRG